MTPEDFKTARDAAGHRYAAAIAELRSAYVELSALDGAANSSNSNVFGVLTFRGDLDHVPESLRHPDFAPGGRDSLLEAVEVRRARILRSLR